MRDGEKAGIERQAEDISLLVLSGVESQAHARGSSMLHLSWFPGKHNNIRYTTNNTTCITTNTTFDLSWFPSLQAAREGERPGEAHVLFSASGAAALRDCQSGDVLSRTRSAGHSCTSSDSTRGSTREAQA